VTAAAGVIQAFFTERLARQRQASPHTVAAYRDTVRMLLAFASARAGKPPSRLDIADLDAPAVSAFLDHLQHDRGNSDRTRNARLAAIHSLFGYAALRHPEHSADIERVLAIPPRNAARTIVTYLTGPEADALLAAPDPATWTGRRDHAWMLLAIQTGLRASELAGLARADVRLGTGPYVACHGKGRKDRITPLQPATVTAVSQWMAQNDGQPAGPLFTTIRGGPMSSDALQQRLTVHSGAAARTCPSLAVKKVTPHVLRHTAAMRLLHAGNDITVIALWLGHENTATTQIYLQADMELKKRALDRTAPLGTAPGQFQPPDQLLAFLEAL
jgi:site-specific recombinase XerD